MLFSWQSDMIFYIFVINDYIMQNVNTTDFIIHVYLNYMFHFY